ncbi:MAG TPA: DUF1631 family protein [Burkholderiales bacterium]|nr:DUF1631 family protein [Burkholderiales bacterium]
MPQATSFDSLLAQCRDLVCGRLDQALAGMLNKADNALSALAGEARDPQAQKLYTVTRNKVLAQRDTIATQFRMRYLREFQERSNRVKKIGDSFANIDLSSLELELVAEDDLNETLRFNAMADKLRQYCEEELVALDQRVGVLLGDANLQAEDNPFTPQAICDAYMRTCHQIDSNLDVRMVLLKLFDDYVLDDVRAIYKDVNAVLVENSILPKIRSAGRQSRDKGSPAGKPDAGAPAEDSATGGEQDFFSVLQNLVAGNLKARAQTGAAGGTGAPLQVAAAGSGGPPVDGIPVAGTQAQGGHAILEGAELLQSLTRIQLANPGAASDGSPVRAIITGEPETTNVLRELKGSSLGAGMNQMDSMTLDIVALLFDQLFDDPKIPIGVKGLIGRLQIPTLKVAIADKSFFSRKNHPARQMLDTLGEISSRLPANVNASNPLFGRLETILQELMDGFEDNIEIFTVVRERLVTLITEEDQRVEQETRSTATQMEQQESLALAKTVAQAEIKVRIRDRAVPRPVVEFLVQQWIKLLLVIQVTDGEDSDAWRNALETMDLLISSVEPKDTQDERRKAVTLVPVLLKRLTDGLKTAGVEDSARLGFFAEMRKLHSELIGKTEKPRAPAPLEASIADSPVQPELPSVDEPSVEPAPVAEIAPASLEEIRLEPAPVADSAAPIPFEMPPVDEPAPMEAAGPEPTHADKPAAPMPFDLPPFVEPAASLSEAVRPESIPPAEPVAPMPFDLPSFDLPLVTQPASAPMEVARPVPAPPPKPPAPTPPVNVAPVAAPVPAPREAVRPLPTPPVRPPPTQQAKAANPAPVDFSAAVTINNPFGKGEVQVDDLDFTAQLGGGTPQAKRATGQVKLPENLAPGTWVAIRAKGEKEPRLAKLSYVSPLKSRFLFVDRHGKTTLECSRTELARRFQLGEVIITKEVSEPPLFDRLAEGLVGKLGGLKAPR